MRFVRSLVPRPPARSTAARLLLAAAIFWMATATLFAAVRSDARSHDFDLQHIRLTLSFDLPERKVIGEAQLTFAPLADGLTMLSLDATQLAIERVSVNAKPARFRTDSDHLWIELDRACRTGEAFDVTIRYQAQPRKGLYFISPDFDYPQRPWQIWSQGEEEDNHYWFPCYDYPNDKTTSEMIVTVPADWVAVSNGKLVSETQDAAHKTRTFHWKETQPHSTYLISLVAGAYVVKREDGPVPLSYYVPPGEEAKVPLSFGRTREMTEFFANWLVPYPWEKYSQAVVEEFIYGAMENTSATTAGNFLLYDERAALDLRVRNDNVIAHELAHQWFGDLVTSKDWRNFWLNEGFADYASHAWIRHRYGEDEFFFRLRAMAEQYLNNARVHRVPIRTMESEALGGLTTLYYAKATWVLHLLEGELGQARMTRALRHYLEANRFQNVDTASLARAVEEATGRNIDDFLDQWIYKPGHPQFDVAWDYDDAKKVVHLSMKQTQKPEDGFPVFRVPVEVEFTTQTGSVSASFNVESAAQEFYYPLPERPLMVLFDKPYLVLKALNFKKSPEEWLYQLKHAEPVAHRLDAADALGKLPSAAATVAGLKAAAINDRFDGVRAAALRALARMAGEDSKAALLAALQDSSSRVRRAVVDELGSLKASPEIVRALEERVNTDPSYYVRAESLEALAKLRPENIAATLRAALQQDSYTDLVRRAALEGFGTLGDDANLPLVLEWTARGRPIDARRAAIAALGKLGKNKKEVREKLLAMLDDVSWEIRLAAVRALQSRGEAAAMEALDRLQAREPNDRVAFNARRAIEELHKAESKPTTTTAEAAKLNQRLSELEKENKELKDRIRALEQQLSARPATAAAAQGR